MWIQAFQRVMANLESVHRILFLWVSLRKTLNLTDRQFCDFEIKAMLAVFAVVEAILRTSRVSLSNNGGFCRLERFREYLASLDPRRMSSVINRFGVEKDVIYRASAGVQVGRNTECRALWIRRIQGKRSRRLRLLSRIRSQTTHRIPGCVQLQQAHPFRRIRPISTSPRKRRLTRHSSPPLCRSFQGN